MIALLKTGINRYLISLLLIPAELFSQPFAPPADQQGTTAIAADNPFITGWAESCLVTRGPAIITNPDSLEVTFGEPEDATGRAGEGKVVSLGDGGYAILHFSDPISNGPGPDFAVFENAFTDSFLELAFVEVSSDGSNFFRFTAVSLTQTEEQVGTYGSIDARNIDNLAGKYRSGYGTPFDLEDLDGVPGLDMMSIYWIKIIDVVGILDEQAGSKDINGNLINDPWPTPFASGGFDLDAVCMIAGNVSSVGKQAGKLCTIYNTLFENYLEVEGIRSSPFTIANMNGIIMRQGTVYEGYNRIDTKNLLPGIYVLSIGDQMPSRIIKFL
jgi:hypothetical protein